MPGVLDYEFQTVRGLEHRAIGQINDLKKSAKLGITFAKTAKDGTANGVRQYRLRLTIEGDPDNDGLRSHITQSLREIAEIISAQLVRENPDAFWEAREKRLAADRQRHRKEPCVAGHLLVCTDPDRIDETIEILKDPRHWTRRVVAVNPWVLNPGDGTSNAVIKVEVTAHDTASGRRAFARLKHTLPLDTRDIVVIQPINPAG